MEMTQIRYFLAVSETLNFTRAAELCFISQPALTKGIKKLESSIGGELLHRTKNSVELSFLGEQLLPKFRQIYQEADIAKKEAKRLLMQQHEVLRVGIHNNIFIGSLLPLFQGFQSDHNGIQFEFLEADDHRLKYKLEHHELDMIFISTMKSCYSETRPAEVYAEGFVIAFGNRHPFAERTDIGITDLHQERFCFRTHCSSSRHLENYLANNGVDLNIVYSSDRDDWVKSFVQGNFGVTFIPKAQAISEGLPFVELNDYQAIRSILLETSATTAQRSPVFQHFIDAIPRLAREYSRQLQVTGPITQRAQSTQTILPLQDVG